MKKKFLFKTLILLIIFILFKSNYIVYAQNKDKVVLQLRWNHEYQFAGYYVAKWMGFYDAEGLDVEIKSAFTSNNSILDSTKEVIEGRADFGIGAVDVLMAENKGANLSVVASIFQRSAVRYYVKSDTPYGSIIDLTKLNIARRQNDLLDIELQAMLVNEGIKLDNSKLLPYSTEFLANDLVTGKYDVIPGYLGTISFPAQQSSIALKVIKPIDYGIDFYGDSLFTTRDLALRDPNLVRKFKKASIKGWEYALEHPVEIANRISTEFKIEGQSVKELEAYNIFEEKEIAPLTLYPVVEIGNINPYRWMKMQEVLLKLRLVNGAPDFNTFIFDYDKIIDDRNKRSQTIFIGLIIGSFCMLIIWFIVRLTTNNVILRKEIDENKKKEALLIRQARLAAMGEMIANIAHQWRQPLNNLGLIISNLEDASLYDELNHEIVSSATLKCRKLIRKMSDTIDDFRYFSNPGNEKGNFSICENINIVLELAHEHLKFNKVNVLMDISNDIVAFGYANQYSQAIFNIINNSIDALAEQDNLNKEIRIKVYKEAEMVAVEISDNGGGIKEENVDKIFDAYFSTKSAKNGTGLGLYMVKLIIENNMSGRIKLLEYRNGVTMKITIPENGVSKVEKIRDK